MSNNKLHIVCFTIPFPVKYGGLFDLYYKLEALQMIGLSIHLHCIQYGNSLPQRQLEKYCETVSYYKRKKALPINFYGLPYIIKSRVIPELIDSINNDDAPVLIEGVHGTGIISCIKDQTRTISVRLHNVEYIYYENLARTASNILKRIYYRLESKRLKRWETKLAKQPYLFNAVSLLDKKIYEEKLRCNLVQYIPLFLPNWLFSSHEEVGKYCLYQGNLDIEENQKAIHWLIELVYVGIDIPLMIAGKSNGKFVETMRAKNPNVQWVENPSDEEMQKIITEAHLHLLPSFNATGIKLKLLNALYNGRFCIANTAMVQDSGLEDLCIVADSIEEFRNRIIEYSTKVFSTETQQFRKNLLFAIYDNTKNAILLKRQLFG